MGYAGNIGKYQLGRTIGEGTFAKVKLAINIINGQNVAVKIIDKNSVMENNLIHQVQREIRTMKLLNHPNIVRIHEVIGTKTKIYIVMEYVPGGQLSDKLSYANKLTESEARKYFQQLIYAMEYCHCRGVYHRDLKPQNLLLDSKGNLKVSDFGLSALNKPGTLLKTACGSPSYVAPELLKNKGYDGAAADIWTCGVILFEMLAGRLPFDDLILSSLYKKIWMADYKFPYWFTTSQMNLIARIFDPDPKMRITIPEIINDKWFQEDYEPAAAYEDIEDEKLDCSFQAAFDSFQPKGSDCITSSQNPGFINAFQLIAMSHDLDLSGLFEDKVDDRQKIMVSSKHTISGTMERIEVAAKSASLSVERMNYAKVKMRPLQKTGCTSGVNLMAEVIEVAPTDCVIKISKSVGQLGMYQEQFCKSLSSLLEEPIGPKRTLRRETSKDDSVISKNLRSLSFNIKEIGIGYHGYSSS